MTVDTIGLDRFIEWQFIKRDTLTLTGEGFTLTIDAAAKLPEALQEIKNLFLGLLTLENIAISQDYDLASAIGNLEADDK